MAESLAHHNDEIVSDITLALSGNDVLDSRAHIEEEAWQELYDAWFEGYMGESTLEDVQMTYYKWFRWERGLPE